MSYRLQLQMPVVLKVLKQLGVAATQLIPQSPRTILKIRLYLETARPNIPQSDMYCWRLEYHHTRNQIRGRVTFKDVALILLWEPDDQGCRSVGFAILMVSRQSPGRISWL